MTSRSLTPNFGTVKDLGLKTGAIVMLAAASVFGAGADQHSQKDYSLALEVSEHSPRRRHTMSP